MIKFLLYLILNINAYSLNINKPERNIVILHLEKFNEKYNLLHVGISFNNNKEILRYDYRSYNQGKTYRTTDVERLNQNIMFPDLINSEEYKILIKYSDFNTFNNDNIDNNKKDIFWGITNKTQKEIINFEKNNLIKKI